MKTIIVDDFYNDPYEIRRFAEKEEYRKGDSLWSGLQSVKMHPQTEETLYKISSFISDSLPDWKSIKASYDYWGDANCGGFMSVDKQNPQSGPIHVHKNGEYTGLVFLTLPEFSKGRIATSFYQHKDSGFKSFEEFDDAMLDTIKHDENDYSKWKLLQATEMKFNRLILFDSRDFHAWSGGFGDSIKNCRLTQIFNFKLS